MERTTLELQIFSKELTLPALWECTECYPHEPWKNAELSYYHHLSTVEVSLLCSSSFSRRAFPIGDTSQSQEKFQHGDHIILVFCLCTQEPLDSGKPLHAQVPDHLGDPLPLEKGVS